jgi:hypothetical protein
MNVGLSGAGVMGDPDALSPHPATSAPTAIASTNERTADLLSMVELQFGSVLLPVLQLLYHTLQPLIGIVGD